MVEYEIKVILVGVLSVTSLMALPVQAAVNVCTHPYFEHVHGEHHGYDCTYETHTEWWQEVEKRCTSCGEEVLKEKRYGNKEPHQWVIDWEHQDDRGYGLVYYEAECNICGYCDTLPNP